jgi:hypothetical protein
VNWLDFIFLGERLVAERPEASRRTGVNRAYYGTLHVCRCWLEARGARVERHRMHAHVWGSFEGPGCSSKGGGEGWEVVAELGNSLRRLRNLADYEDVLPDLEREAAEAVGTAKQILSLLPALELAD